MKKLNGSGLRRPDWPLLLEVYIERLRAQPFAWGTHDCVTFAIGWLELARSDLSPREELAESLDYSTVVGALRALRGRELQEAVDDWGRLTSVAVPFAQRGDLVLVETSGRPSLSVCVGDYAAGPGITGLELVPLVTARAAWRV
jgi:hypothetical protein